MQGPRFGGSPSSSAATNQRAGGGGVSANQRARFGAPAAAVATKRRSDGSFKYPTVNGGGGVAAATAAPAVTAAAGFSASAATSTATSSSKENEIMKQRKALPIFTARKRFLEEVNQHETVILVGETGSGKTTQVPQFLHEERLDAGPGGAIAVTQPRRVAAVSLAARVAEEMNAVGGSLVGYKVRFEDRTTPATKIVFLTDGMLLREAMIDPLLSRFSWIILDEAHERTLHTDLLFGVVKAAQARRRNLGQQSQPQPQPQPPQPQPQPQPSRPLKVIVMSATLEADKFAAYFGPPAVPVLLIEGRQFPVDVRHACKPQQDWQHAVLSTVFQLHEELPAQHDFLVFLTGQEEIENMVRQVRTLGREFVSSPRLMVHALYAAQQTAVQQKVFTATSAGARKIILSTNIGETALTIPGVRVVVDGGRVKAKAHIATTGMDLLKVVRASKASADQRAGRAGREAPGSCYRMLTRAEFAVLPAATAPEILRCNLACGVLQMLAIGVADVQRFDFLECPPKDALDGALRQLKLLGAVEDMDVSGAAAQRLTALGRTMAGFPLDPKFTKMIMRAKELGCTEEVVTIVSLLTGESVAVNSAVKRDEAAVARKKFASSDGDHVTLLNVFRAFKQTAPDAQRDWCLQHFVSHRHLSFAVEVRKQLLESCRRAGVPVQSAGRGQRATELVRRAVAAGLFANVARLTTDGHYVTLDSRVQVKIHPSSVMFQTKPELVVFTELIQTQQSYIRDLSLVDPMWLHEAQPEYFRQHRIFTSSEH